MSLRIRGFLEREHYPRDHHWKVPEARLRPNGFESEAFGRTRCFRYSTGNNSVNERTWEMCSGITYMPGSSWIEGYKCLSKR